jgi:iron complex outermembrane receptor protein
MSLKKLFLLSRLAPMIRIYLSLIFVFAVISGTIAQARFDTLKKDSVRHLQPITIRAYLSEQPVLSVPASVSVINQQQLNLQPDNSFVSVLNSVPGVRAEERSPGSYRLSIRGSLISTAFIIWKY